MTEKLKPQKWNALILSFAEFLRREPTTVLTHELDDEGKRIRLFGYMVPPWKDVRAEVARLRELQRAAA